MVDEITRANDDGSAVVVNGRWKVLRSSRNQHGVDRIYYQHGYALPRVYVSYRDRVKFGLNPLYHDFTG
jgi:hypothetical protein